MFITKSIPELAKDASDRILDALSADEIDEVFGGNETPTQTLSNKGTVDDGSDT